MSPTLPPSKFQPATIPPPSEMIRVPPGLLALPAGAVKGLSCSEHDAVVLLRAPRPAEKSSTGRVLEHLADALTRLR